jgi:hypothetical protein
MPRPLSAPAQALRDLVVVAVLRVVAARVVAVALVAVALRPRREPTKSLLIEAATPLFARPPRFPPADVFFLQLAMLCGVSNLPSSCLPNP